MSGPETIAAAPSFRRSPWRHPSLIIGGIIVALIVTAALVSLVWTPHPPTKLNIPSRLQGPSATFWLGTDHFGRDVFSMLMVGARNSLAVGIVAVSIGAVFGVLLGTASAARSGSWLDEAIMRTADFTFAFPAVLSAVMITALAGPGVVNAIIAIGIYNIPIFARLTRSGALQVWSRDYVMAARAAGKTAAQITMRHVIPNIAGLIIVQATIQFATAILAEAGLSYLGLGTQPPNPSWGRMLFEAQTTMQRQPLLAIFPGLTIVVAVLGCNLLGDGLRDVLDPRVNRSRS
ncbi:MAG TPA: ABC transporter permease [Beijerinckiaceae bacterium]|nr:ABC transporter permease [Beijerinckiaceae bacterium]